MKNIFLEHPIAHGRTADVYEWETGHVLKLFHNWFERGNIEYELKIARAVNASGVDSPAVGELIQIEGRNGLVYQRVQGDSMEVMFRRRPWMLFRCAGILARLHAQMHERVFNADVPTQRRRLENKIQHADALPISLKSSLSKALRSLPEGDRVCHGDFHPGNVLLSGRDAAVIDWIDASRGNPLADVARTSILALGAAASTQTSNLFEKIFMKVFHAAYLRRYFSRRPHGQDEYRRWLPIVAAARLSEGIPELEMWLLEQARKVQ